MRRPVSRVAQVWLLFLTLASVGLPVYADVATPNALERRVDAIPATQLMAAPATTLVDAERQVAAARYVRWHSPGFFASVLLAIAALAYFWRSGAAARVRDRLQRSFRSKWAVRFCFGALLAAIAKFASLVPAFYLYRVDRVMGVSSERTHTWVLDWLLDLVLAMIVAGAVAAFVLWLADRTHQWYIYTIVGIIAACILVSFVNPFLIAPLYNAHSPLHAPMAGQLAALERSAGYNIPIVVEDRSKRTQTEGSALTGLAASQEIVLADTLLASSTPDEDAFYVAHALGHAAHRDSLRLSLLNALVIIVGVALAVFVADRVGFRRDDDPVSRLALVGAFLGCAYLLAVPVYDAALRSMERQADAYAVGLLKDPAPAVRAMIRLADERIIAVCPSPFDTLYFGRFPAIAERVGAFNHVPPACP